MSPTRRRTPRVPPEASLTLRQLLVRLLRLRTQSFEDLRLALRVPRRVLEEHLQHVARSARAADERLEAEPAHCADCDFGFGSRESRPFHVPGRCPRCRSERIEPPRLRLVPNR